MRLDGSLASGAMGRFRSRSCFLWDLKANGITFASLGPVKVAFEIVRFQGLYAMLRVWKRGNTAHAWADSFKCARAVTRMLNKSVFSPARPPRLLHPPALSLPRQPLCPGTRFSPGGVLASLSTSVKRESYFVNMSQPVLQRETSDERLAWWCPIIRTARCCPSHEPLGCPCTGPARRTRMSCRLERLA